MDQIILQCVSVIELIVMEKARSRVDWKRGLSGPNVGPGMVRRSDQSKPRVLALIGPNVGPSLVRRSDQKVPFSSRLRLEKGTFVHRFVLSFIGKVCHHGITSIREDGHVSSVR